MRRAAVKHQRSEAGSRKREWLIDYWVVSSLRASLRFVSALLCVLALASLTLAQEATPTPQQQSDAAQKTGNAPEAKKSNERPVAAVVKPEPFDGAAIEKMAAQCVTLETEAGLIEIEMLAETAPETVRNFLNLAATGAFDTTTFSRVVKDFVVQGGNLATSQKWGTELSQRARRTIPDEPNAVKHVRGIVSMARSDKPNSATTNFFILVGDASHLDNKFAAFARVVRGMEIVDAMNKATLGGERGETPEKPVRITRASVKECAAKQNTESAVQKPEEKRNR
jgi:cyclophilin family peptidyl-prolyl cis-trans isomerase